MSRLYTLVMLSMICAVGFAQNHSTPTKIFRPISSDRTPELRSMKIVVAGSLPVNWEKNEVLNMIERSNRNLKSASMPDFDPVVQNTPGKKTASVPAINMDGIRNLTGVLPSDANGAVGINHFIQVVNCNLAIWDKEGNILYGPVDTKTLWNGFEGPWEGTNDGDGVVVYDEMAHRWLVSQFSIPVANEKTGPYYQLIAVSQTEDPLGAWNRYAYSFDQFNDYPKFGVWNDGYYSTYNMYLRPDNTTLNNFLGTAVMVFDRQAMMDGDPDAQGIYFKSSYLLGGLPGDLDGQAPPQNAPNVVVAIDSTLLQMAVYEFSMDWEHPELSAMNLAARLKVADFVWNFDGVPQPGSEIKLDNIPDRLMYRLQHRCFEDYEVLLTNHTVKVGEINAVRWYELRKYPSKSWEIYQQGTFSPDSLHRWMGSMAMNGKGEIALGYSAGNAGHWASPRYTGQTPGNLPGQMNMEEVEPASGSQVQDYSHRWGDYSSMAVDPANDETFWFTSQYAGASNWKTRIVAFNLGNIPDPTVDAGVDTLICSTSRFYTNPDILNEKSINWTTTGDGNILWPTERSAQYKPGNQDIANGGTDLIVTAIGYRVGSVSRDTLHVSIQLCAGIDETDLSGQVVVFPNPSKGTYHLTINGFKDPILKMEIINPQGQVVFTQELNSASGSYTNLIDLSQFPSGTYFLRVYDREKVVVRNLVKL